jgi:NitT/TauT family transport system permease protein
MALSGVGASLSAAPTTGTAPEAPPPRRRARGWVRLLLAPVIGVLAFGLAWQLYVTLFHVKKFVLPAPSTVIRHIASDPGFYVRNARTTLWEALCGFVVALVVSLLPATLMAASRFVERAILPLVVLLQVTPIIAYAPAVVIWRGFGFQPVLIITALVCIPVFLINAVTGLRAVDPAALELLQSVDAPRREVFWRLRLPSALPFLFSAARIAVGLALIGAVIGEFFAGTTRGLGWSVKVAQSRSLTDQLWGSILVLALVGSIAMVLIGVLERVLVRWHSSQTTLA